MVSPVMADMLFLAFRFRDALVRSLRTFRTLLLLSHFSLVAFDLRLEPGSIRQRIVVAVGTGDRDRDTHVDAQDSTLGGVVLRGLRRVRTRDRRTTFLALP